MHGFVAFFVAFEDRCAWDAVCQHGQAGGVLAKGTSCADVNAEACNICVGFFLFTLFLKLFFFFLVVR